MIPVNRPLLNGNEKKYVNDCINSNWISSNGKYIQKFEKNFSKFLNVKYSTTVTSGTAALDLATEAIDLKESDEVIVPNFCIISPILNLIRKKVKLVFIDCDDKTYNVRSDDVIKKITPRTKLIIIAHIYGLCTNIKPIVKIAKEKKILIIEDCAESLGLNYYKKKCGTFGDISTFSFYANKIVTSGEGGMVCTNSKKFINRIKLLKNLYFKKNRFLHSDLGWNYRMTNIQAAIGLAQLENINKNIKRKIKIGQMYTKNLNQILDKIMLPPNKTEFCNNTYWVYGLIIKKNVKLSAKKLASILLKYGIETRPFFYPLNKQKVLMSKKIKFNENFLKNSNFLYKKGLYLPSGSGTTNKEIIYVCKILKKIFNNA